MLLVSIRIDADGGIFPIVFGIVEIEDAGTWEWLFLHAIIPSLRDPRKITFILDQMQRIQTGLKNVWLAPHFYLFVLHHIKANFRKEVRDSESEKWFYQTGLATHELHCNDFRQKISQTGKNAFQEV